MTIKKPMKTTEPATPEDGSAVVADRFKLDVPNANGGSSGVATTIALVAGLIALAVVGVLTFVIYQHWEYLQAA